MKKNIKHFKLLEVSINKDGSLGVGGIVSEEITNDTDHEYPEINLYDVEVDITFDKEETL